MLRSVSPTCYSLPMSLPSASPAPLLDASDRTRALLNGTAARICDEDGLIKYPTADGPEWFACHGCAGCNPPPRVFGPQRDRVAASVAAVFADSPTRADDEPF